MIQPKIAILNLLQVLVYDGNLRRKHRIANPNGKRFRDPSAVIFSTDLENFAIKDDFRVCLFSSDKYEYVGEIPLNSNVKLMG